MRCLTALALILLLAGCPTGSTGTDAGTDAGPDCPKLDTENAQLLNAATDAGLVRKVPTHPPLIDGKLP